MAGKDKADEKTKRSTDRVVCRNRRARHEYEILDEIECGMQLMGSEIKSIRNGKVTIDDAFARVENGELWLFNADIAEYPQASYMNHARKRQRKLLVRKRELRKFAEAAEQSGFTLIALDVHFTRGIAKVTLAVGKGRKDHDKRDKLRKADAGRQMRDAVRKSRG
jgi:SsrA-binding protein